MAMLHLLVGLPASGKTTEARRLASSSPMLRLTPDEWMIPLFGEPEAGGKRDVLEGRLITLALQALRLEVDVVLDLGCWGRDERSALRWLTEQQHTRFRMIYLPVDRGTQVQRIAARWNTAPHETYPMTDSDVDRWRDQFEEPDAEELAGAAYPLPSHWHSWLDWAADRWPSLSTE